MEKTPIDDYLYLLRNERKNKTMDDPEFVKSMQETTHIFLKLAKILEDKKIK